MEVLIIDDGSTDGTPDLGRRLAVESPRVRYIRQENAGLSAARNAGLREARHPFVAFLDADDEWLPGMLPAVMAAFHAQPPDTGLIACNSFRIDSGGEAIGEKRTAPRGDRYFTAADILIKTRFMPSCVVARRSCFETAGFFDTQLRSSEDRDMWIRIARTHRVFYLDQPLVRIRKHGSNMSRCADRMLRAMRSVRQKAFHARVVPAADAGFWLRMLAIEHFQAGWMYWDEALRSRALLHAGASLLLWPLPLNRRDLHEPPLFRPRAAVRFLLGRRPAPAPQPPGRPLRILHVLFSLEAGGMENGVVNVSRALEGRGFEMHVCCLARGGAFVGRFTHPERVRILGKSEGFSPATVRALARHIREIVPDVIHTHNLGPLIYSGLAAPGAKDRILHGEHAELTPAERSPRRKLIRRLLYTRVRQVHTVSAALRETLIAEGFPGNRVDVVVNGVDALHFSPGPRDDACEQTGLPAHALVLGLVGRFGEFKRHAELIEAFDRLPVEMRNLHLVFIGGGGPLEASVRARVAASPHALRIHFAGFQEDPRPWYRSLDLLVIPSVNEGLSNALLEAMACGIPALAHHACGSAEVIEDSVNGFLRDLDSPGKIATALADALLQPALLPALGQAACQTVRARFSFDAMAAGYERLYRHVATANAS
jgi:glycosyltransferase involved in cell wall biosynthesis